MVRGSHSQNSNALRGHLATAALEVDQDLPSTQQVTYEAMLTSVYRRWEEKFLEYIDTHGTRAPDLGLYVERTQGLAKNALENYLELSYMLLLRDFDILVEAQSVCTEIKAGRSTTTFADFVTAYVDGITAFVPHDAPVYVRRMRRNGGRSVTVVEFPSRQAWIVFRMYLVAFWRDFPDVPEQMIVENQRWASYLNQAAQVYLNMPPPETKPDVATEDYDDTFILGLANLPSTKWGDMADEN